MLDNLEKYIHLYLYTYQKYPTPLSILSHLFFCNGNGSNYTGNIFGMEFYTDHNLDIFGVKYVNFLFSNCSKTNADALGDFDKKYHDYVLPFIKEEKPEYLNLKLDDYDFWYSQVKLEINKCENFFITKFYPDQMISCEIPYINMNFESKTKNSLYYVPIYDHIADVGDELFNSKLYDFVGLYGDYIIKAYEEIIPESTLRESLKEHLLSRIEVFKKLHNTFKYSGKTL